MSKPIWEKDNPKQRSTKLTPAQQTAAKRQAKEHGRSKPSLVDNINAQKGRTGAKRSKSG